AARGKSPGAGAPIAAHSTTTAATAPAIARSVPWSTCRSRRWPSSCARISFSSRSSASASSVSQTTTRRVGPSPETYAFVRGVRPHEGGEHELDRLPLRPICEPAAGRLRRQPEAPLAHEPAPGVERKAHDPHGGEDDDRPDKRAPEPAEPAEGKLGESTEHRQHDE